MSGKITGLNTFTQAADPNKNWRDGLANFFGQGVEQQLGGRQLKKGKIEANFWDRLNGRSTEELTEQYYQNRAEAIKNSAAGDNVLTDGKNIDVTARDGQILRQSEDVNTGRNLRAQVEATGQYQGNVDDLRGKSNPELRAILPGLQQQQAAALKRSDPEFIANQDQTKAVNKRLEAEAIERARQFDIQEARIAETARQNNLNRANDRLLTAQTNQLNLQLKYAQLAQSDKNRREDKREKALLTLLTGLGNLGAAFTV